ncbi:MAG: ABC transporter transmembrane domain-containing protein, partial [Pseudomonadota bacterium]
MARWIDALADLLRARWERRGQAIGRGRDLWSRLKAEAALRAAGAARLLGSDPVDGPAERPEGAGGEAMPASLAKYIWRYSKRDQLFLLLVTLATFPLLYASLELPKLIINDAISAETETIAAFGYEFTRVQYLMLLCFGFLAAVLGGGLFKMQLNTMKGVVSERMLRRFRFQLISRTLRFPLPQFQRTSQGELISMVTAEAEPLGGAMGDFLAQPVFQAGQMLTIMLFLFMQNFWLGLAAVALIPLQAWLIPYLQRRINLLHKQRVQEVRRLSARFGETIAGVEDLRVNNGVRFALADFSARLGTLFSIRYEIYRRKFFMKFLNNLITQITPFFFFSIGGYLAIQGDLTVGALVAALAAYKDLSAPWRELLTYYTQIQELSHRYLTIIDQFAPGGLLPARLFEGEPASAPKLNGAIAVREAVVREQGGAPVIDRLSFEAPGGGMIAIQSKSASERRALIQLLSRAIAPNAGRVTIGEHDLADLHQSVASLRIGVVASAPYLFNGRVGDNVGMALRSRPRSDGGEGLEPMARSLTWHHNFDEAEMFDATEAARSGNPLDPIDRPWLDPTLAGVETENGLRDWWVRIVQTVGTDDVLFQRGLGQPFSERDHPELAARLVDLRDEARFRIRAAGLDRKIHWFDPERFNPGLAIAGNLLFAAPRRPTRAEDVAQDPRFPTMVREIDLEPDLLAMGGDILNVLSGVFGGVGASHPLFQRLGLGAELFETLLRIAERRQAKGPQVLCDDDRALVMALPFQLTAEQIGQGFSEELKQKILRLRRARGAELRGRAADVFSPLERDRFVEGLSTVENVLFGKIAAAAPKAVRDKVWRIICDLLEERDLRGEIALLIADAEVGVGGAKLDRIAHERIAFVRAAIKRPDLLLMDTPLSSHPPEDRLAFRQRLRALLPESTLVFVESEIARASDFDLVIEIENGRIADAGSEVEVVDGDAARSSGAAGLIKKRRVFETSEVFRDLARPQLRLLAFASEWFHAEPDQHIFRFGEPTDAAYILTEGEAELRWTDETGAERVVTVVQPGRLIGDLSIILDQNRNLDMVAISPVKGLRIGAEELRDVIRADPAVAYSLLGTVSGHLINVIALLRNRQTLDEVSGPIDQTGASTASR